MRSRYAYYDRDAGHCLAPNGPVGPCCQRGGQLGADRPRRHDGTSSRSRSARPASAYPKTCSTRSLRRLHLTEPWPSWPAGLVRNGSPASRSSRARFSIWRTRSREIFHSWLRSERVLFGPSRSPRMDLARASSARARLDGFPVPRVPLRPTTALGRARLRIFARVVRRTSP